VQVFFVHRTIVLRVWIEFFDTFSADMQDQNQLAEMEGLLREMLRPNTDSVRSAVDILNKKLKQSSSMVTLFQLFHASQQAEVSLLQPFKSPRSTIPVFVLFLGFV
jgi:hypothetical protein